MTGPLAILAPISRARINPSLSLVRINFTFKKEEKIRYDLLMNASLFTRVQLLLKETSFEHWQAFRLKLIKCRLFYSPGILKGYLFNSFALIHSM